MLPHQAALRPTGRRQVVGDLVVLDVVSDRGGGRLVTMRNLRSRAVLLESGPGGLSALERRILQCFTHLRSPFKRWDSLRIELN